MPISNIPSMISNSLARSAASSAGGSFGMSMPRDRRTSSGMSPASSPSKNLSIRSSSAITSFSSSSINATAHLHAPRLPRNRQGVNFFYREWRPPSPIRKWENHPEPIMKAQKSRTSPASEIKDLTSDAVVNDALAILRTEFDRELAYLREPDAGRKLRSLFEATPDEFAHAANTAPSR